MADNTNLRRANKEKNDEFYTQLVDIENELKHYKEHFKDKIVFCNCDDPYESNFFKYFAINFNYLGLKKLMCTCYDNSPVAYTQLSFFGVNENKEITNHNRHAYKIEINEVKDMNNDGAVDLADVTLLLQNKKNTLTYLKGNGDFRSQECIELLKESDIVVTNPPFSLFREYVAQLMGYNKKFLIIGNQNAITYKEIFKLIKEDKIWLGLTMNGSNRYFQVPDSYPLTEKTGKIENGKKYAFVKSVVWFTNLETKKRYEPLPLYKKYNEQEYPKYDNYDAINVDKVNDIPEDYYDRIGVPISFFHKYCPTQFEIIGQGQGNLYRELTEKGLSAKFVEDYYASGQTGKIKEDHPVLGYYDSNGKPVIPYMRIIIRRKKNEN